MIKLNSVDLLQMLQSGCNNLANKHQEIDALNVFPVPDGDTGTNMNLTFTNGYNEIKDHHFNSVSELTKVFSRGLLMGARGNSGVILSQIFRGFSQGVAGCDEIDAKQFAHAFLQGKEVAYKAVMRPVEGTILTVLRISAEKTVEYVNNASYELTIIDTLNYMIKKAKEALDSTPDLLPVLKEVGVVDSGGAGYLVILEGFQAYLNDNPVLAQQVASSQTISAQAQFEHEEFGYCTEFIVQLNEKSMTYFNENTFRQELEQLGNSLVVVQDEDIVKVHVHTLTPGDALNLGQRYGEFVKLKIENMSTQHASLLDHNVENLSKGLKVETKAPDVKEMQDYAIIAVAAGAGLEAYFKQLRVDHIISGGQTMNPSTEDFVAMMNQCHAHNILVLPNNSNIILAANQAKELMTEKQVIVLPAVSIPEGLAACIAFNPQLTLDENTHNMTQAIENTKSGQVTYAIKDTSFNGISIKAGDYMAIFGKQILHASTDQLTALKTLVTAMLDEDAEIVTLILGEGVVKESVEELIQTIEDEYDVTVECVQGDQPVYSFIIGVE